jgi:hypothetical protein
MGAILATFAAMALICLATAKSADIKVMRNHPTVVMVKRICVLTIVAVIALFLWPRP